MRSLLVASVLMVVLFGVEIPFNREWLSGSSTQDEQQYIISEQTIDLGLVDEGKADDSMADPQSITTTNLDEAIAFLGFAPAMPQWMPDGWELLPYYASRTASSERFVATYAHDEQDYNLVYQTVYYYDAERASAAFEQNRTGEEIDLANGKTVYISENFNDTTCVWYESLACYSLAGPENTDTINESFEKTISIILTLSLCISLFTIPTTAFARQSTIFISYDVYLPASMIAEFSATTRKTVPSVSISAR